MSNKEQQHVVLLKTPRSGEDPFVQAIQARGLSASCVPVLDIEYLSTSELRDALLRPTCYAGLILTSQNAVEALQRTIHPESADGANILPWESDLKAAWSMLPAFVVGPSTRRQVVNLGLNAEGDESGNAAALADVILHRFTSPPAKSLLFPCGNLSDELLPTRLREKGYTVDAITVYNTAASRGFAARWDNMTAATEGAALDSVVFFSPSGVRYTVDHLRQQKVIDCVKIIAIGPSTRKELESHGVHVYCTSAKPDPESLAEAITGQGS